MTRSAYQADATTVRNDRYAILLRHEQDGHNFIDPTKPTRIDLADVNRAGL